MFNNYYKKIYDNKEFAHDSFIKRFKLFKKEGSDFKRINMRSYADLRKEDSRWYSFISERLTEQHRDDSAVFITLTLVPDYHKITGQNSNRYIPKNIENIRDLKLRRFNFIDRDQAIKEGYNELNKAMKKIYNKFRIGRSFYKVHYIKVLEPHKKDFTPHLHGLLFVDTELLSEFIDHIKKTLKNIDSMGSFDIQIMKETKKASGYITKYINKTLENTEYKGWGIKHKLRLFTYSRFTISRALFKIISGRVSYNRDLLKDHSLINILLQSCEIEVQKFKSGELIKTEYFGSGSAKVFVRMNYRHSSFNDDNNGYYAITYWCIQDNVKIIEKSLYYSIEDVIEIEEQIELDELNVFLDQEEIFLEQVISNIYSK